MDEATVRHLIALARLSLPPAEAERAGRDLSAILEHFKSLDQAPVEGVPPFSPADLRADVFREDEPAASLPLEEALRAAPARDGPFFVVPKTVPSPVRSPEARA